MSIGTLLGQVGEAQDGSSKQLCILLSVKKWGSKVQLPKSPSMRICVRLQRTLRKQSFFYDVFCLHILLKPVGDADLGVASSVISGLSDGSPIYQ